MNHKTQFIERIIRKYPSLDNSEIILIKNHFTFYSKIFELILNIIQTYEFKFILIFTVHQK